MCTSFIRSSDTHRLKTENQTEVAALQICPVNPGATPKRASSTAPFSLAWASNLIKTLQENS